MSCLIFPGLQAQAASGVPLTPQRARHFSTAASQHHSQAGPKHKRVTSGPYVSAKVLSVEHDGGSGRTAICDAPVDEHSDPAEEPSSRRRVQQDYGRNWYRKSLALCATAESLRSHEGGPYVAAALREATSAERLEARCIFTGVPKDMAGSNSPGSTVKKGRRQLEAPLLVGRSPQSLLLSLPGASLTAQSPPAGSGRTWKVLYGGLLRTHGGLGVSRLQKDVAGTGRRLEPNEVVRIQALKESELYVGKGDGTLLFFSSPRSWSVYNNRWSRERLSKKGNCGVRMELCA